MEFALGVLHWSAEQFWKSTLIELMAGNKGYLRVTKPPNNADDAMTQEEFEELKAQLGED